MGEIGHDLHGATTRSALDLLKQGRRYDLVITVCSRKASDLCPPFPGRSLRLNWPFTDPSTLEGDRESQLKEIRVIRDAIRRQVETFLAEYRVKGLTMFL